MTTKQFLDDPFFFHRSVPRPAEAVIKNEETRVKNEETKLKHQETRLENEETRQFNVNLMSI